MIQPNMGKGLKIGRPKTPEERAKRAERLDGRIRERESVVEYQRRVMGQIESLDWGSQADDEPEL